MTDLHDAVHQLCNPHDVAVQDAGRIIATRTDPALLTALRLAKTSNVGHGSGATAEHHTRTSLNIAAVELDHTITRQLRRWIRATTWTPDSPRWPTNERLLAIWYSRNYQRADLDPHIATLRSWIRAIQDLTVNPPRHWTINAPCPTCGNRWAETGPENHRERTPALHVTERDNDHEHDIECRHCGAHWHGIDEARQLNLALEIPA